MKLLRKILDKKMYHEEEKHRQAKNREIREANDTMPEFTRINEKQL